MTKSVNVAVIGLGAVASGHLRILRKTDKVHVVAVCDSDKQKARGLAKAWRIPAYYSDIDAMFRKQSILVVDICTPPQTHRDLVIRALESGCHVIMEKPLTMTTKEAKAIISAHRATKTKVSVIHNNLFEPVMRKALSLIKKGDLGRITNVGVCIVAPATDPMLCNKDHWCHLLPGGRFGEMLAHPIYILQAILGQIQIKSVYATKVGGYAWVPFDELLVAVEANNSYGSIYCSFNSVQDGWFIDVYGTKGIIRLNLVNETLVRLKQRPITTFSRGGEGLKQAYQLFRCTAQNGLSKFFGRWSAGHEVCIRGFVDSVLFSKAPPVTLEEAYNVVETLEQICERIEATRLSVRKKE